MKDCEFKDCLNGFEIRGYELVDLLNNLFIDWKGGSTLLPGGEGIGCWFIDTSKLQITSCEFVKWVEALPATNPFIGKMIGLYGSGFGAVSISSCIIHPRVDQDGVYLETNTITFVELNISANTFISVGLTTGSLIDSNGNPNYDNVAIVEANSGIPNLKSRVGAQFNVENTTTDTATSGTPADIQFGTSVLTPFSSFGVTVAGTGGITYNRKRPVNFQVTFVANLQAITGGSGQRVGLTASKNGVNIPVYSYVTLDSAGTEPKQVVLTIVGDAVSGDVFRSQLINTSTTSNIRCRDILVSGIEI